MARLSKSHAARQLGISRTSLYKLIHEGRLSATPDGLVDEAELVRVAPYVDTFKERTQPPVDTAETVHARSQTPVHARPRTSMDSHVHEQERQPESAREHLMNTVHEQPVEPNKRT